MSLEDSAGPEMPDARPEAPASKDWLISAGGALSSGATIGGLYWIYTAFGLDLSSFSVWFVLPVGAVLAGMAAASGYFAAAKWTHTMPTRRFLLDALVIALGAWAMLLWLKYTGMRFEDGTAIRESVDFVTWFKATTETASLHISSRGGAGFDTGELGGWGYLREFVEFVGFAAGGVGVYGLLDASPQCRPCSKYMRTRRLTSPLSPADFDAVIDEAELELPDIIDNLEAAVASRGLSAIGLELQTCPGCAGQHVVPLAWIGRSKDPVRLQGYRASADLLSQLQTVIRDRKAS